MSLILRNPHSVLAVLQQRPKDVIEIVVPPKASTPSWDQVIALAQKQGITLKTSFNRDRSQRHPKASSKDESLRMSVAEAIVREKPGISIEELFRKKPEADHCLYLALDHLQDPHNLGAIFRTAAFFGVQGIILTQDRSAPLTGIVYDVASGGIESVPYVQATNLKAVFDLAKENGLWILGTSEHAQDDLKSIQRDRPWLLVLGNEERGMRRLTEESCDVLCQISSKGSVKSLNVSVAAGICISHLA